MRAKKFGVPLSETAKKEARAARFNITSENKNGTTTNGSAASIKNSKVVIFFAFFLTYSIKLNDAKLLNFIIFKEINLEQLKKRAERFGTSVSTLVQKAEIKEKLEKRKARFG